MHEPATGDRGRLEPVAPAATTPPRRRRRGPWQVLLLASAALVVLAVAYYAVHRLYAVTHRVRSMPGATSIERGRASTLRLATFNIAHGRGGKLGASNFDGGDTEAKAVRLEKIGALLRQADVDVAVLHEVDFGCPWSGYVNQAAIVAEAAGLGHVVEQDNFAVVLPLVRCRFGNAILSRYPLENPRVLSFEPKSRLEAVLVGNHDAVAAEVLHPGGTTVTVLGVHLDARSPEVRLRAAKEVLEFKARTATPVVVVGDLNARAEDPAPNALSLLLDGTGWSARAPGAPWRKTFPSERPDRTIDYILVPAPWPITEHTVIPTDLSDHLPVVLEVEVPVEDGPRPAGEGGGEGIGPGGGRPPGGRAYRP